MKSYISSYVQIVRQRKTSFSANTNPHTQAVIAKKASKFASTKESRQKKKDASKNSAEKSTNKTPKSVSTNKPAVEKVKKKYNLKPKPTLDKLARDAVEAILDRRLNRETYRREYLIKWAGFDSKHNSWEVITNLKKSDRLIKEFEEKRMQTERQREEEDSPEQKEAIRAQVNKLVTSTERKIVRVVSIDLGCKVLGTGDVFYVLFDDGSHLRITEVQLPFLSPENFRFIENYYSRRINEITRAKEIAYSDNLALGYILMGESMESSDEETTS